MTGVQTCALPIWQRLPGRWDRSVRAELHSGRDHRGFCSGLAADRGGVVCAADGVEVD